MKMTTKMTTTKTKMIYWMIWYLSFGPLRSNSAAISCYLLGKVRKATRVHGIYGSVPLDMAIGTTAAAMVGFAIFVVGQKPMHAPGRRPLVASSCGWNQLFCRPCTRFQYVGSLQLRQDDEVTDKTVPTSRFLLCQGSSPLPPQRRQDVQL